MFGHQLADLKPDVAMEHPPGDKAALCRYHEVEARQAANDCVVRRAGPMKCSGNIMKCLICGRVSLPGAKLCLDCKAARKRAFDATVTQPLLATGAAGVLRSSARAPQLVKPRRAVTQTASRAAGPAHVQTTPATEAAPPAPIRSVPWPAIIAVLLVAGSAVAYFGHGFGGRAATMAAVPDGPNAAPPADSSPLRSAAPAVPSAQPAALTAVAAPVEVPAQEAPAPVKSDVNKRLSARPRVEKAAVAPPVAAPVPPPEVVVVAPPPPPVVRQAPRDDPFQAMYDAIARCPRDSSSCEQRLRLQYCEGHWGQVAQCANMPYIDHGS